MTELHLSCCRLGLCLELLICVSLHQATGLVSATTWWFPRSPRTSIPCRAATVQKLGSLYPSPNLSGPLLLGTGLGHPQLHILKPQPLM